MWCVVQNSRFYFGIAIVAVCLSPNLFAQTLRSDPQASTKNADALVREVIHNEIEAQLHDTSLWCYREHNQEDGKPSKTLEVCQTKDGELERLMAQNGRELDRAQRQADDERLQKLISHPEQLRAKQKKEREDGEQERSMLKLFPEAFHFQCESESEGRVTVRFRPNPAFRPNTRAALVFHHMEGTLVLDTKDKRLVEIDGRLTSEVRFLGGLLGHLDKDGTFLVKQQEVGGGHWDLSHMSVHMDGKALFFKTITVVEKKTLVDYKPLPRGATLQQAADFLMRDFDIHTASSASSSAK
ncbi:MAG: hypothetical protein JWO71_4336 [Candidatus Acidoferrum typicum]|nr:hypothetical protein [Candidatus Acidoferrum typicum]